MKSRSTQLHRTWAAFLYYRRGGARPGVRLWLECATNEEALKPIRPTTDTRANSGSAKRSNDELRALPSDLVTSGFVAAFGASCTQQQSSGETVEIARGDPLEESCLLSASCECEWKWWSVASGAAASS